MTDHQLYTIDPPAHDGTLYTAPRPLPGRTVGYVGSTGFQVFDIGAEFEDLARRDGGETVLVTTHDEFEAAVIAAVEAGGYTKADYEAAGVWDVPLIGCERGLVLITVQAR